MKTYYELLSLASTAPADEIKRAFRREIARYHPDKVQHLGPEFQDIAAARAAELTEAYRVLMDAEARERYDAGLRNGVAQAPPHTSRGSAPVPAYAEPAAETATPPRRDVQADQSKINEFVRRAIVARVREGAERLAAQVSVLPAAGFDLAFVIKPKSGLFKKADPPLRLLVRIVPVVDGAVVEESWPLAVKAAGADGGCLLLLGSSGIAPSKDLSAAVAGQRRKARAARLVVVPVDVRDWDALFPPDTPPTVRTLIQWLREGNG